MTLGEMTASKYRRKITNRIMKPYLAYFGCVVRDQDKNCATHVCCLDCSNRLNKWFAGGKPTLSFAVPMVWRERILYTSPKNTFQKLYFPKKHLAETALSRTYISLIVHFPEITLS